MSNPNVMGFVLDGDTCTKPIGMKHLKIQSTKGWCGQD